MIQQWRMFILPGLALFAIALFACADDESGGDPAEGDDVPNVTVTALQPESEGTGVPHVPLETPTGDIPTPTPEGPTPVTSGEVTQVVIGDDLAVEDMTISAGDSIEWFNEDDEPHTIASTEEGAWASGEPLHAEVGVGESVLHQFTTPGEYPLTLTGGAAEATWTVTVE